jgi:4'-phosphopantetheinyl transferase
MESGILFLERKNRNFQCGFSVIKNDILSENYVSILHKTENEYFDTLRYEKRRKSYLLGRIAAKDAISQIAPIEDPSLLFIDSGVFNFPVVKYFNGLNVQVSISHSNDIGIALAFPEDHPLGVDIEKVDDSKKEIFKSQICEREVDLLSCLDISAIASFTMNWTVKEALSKILKTGLTIDFQLLEVNSINKVDLTFISSFANFPQYKGLSAYIGAYIYSVVLPKNTHIQVDRFWDLIRKETVSKI